METAFNQKLHRGIQRWGYLRSLKRRAPGRRAVLAACIFFLVFIITASFGSWSCAPKGYSGPVEPITVGTMANAGDTLIFVAEEQRYFADNGLNVTLITYDSGLAATEAMLRGEVDLAYATEFIIVGEALKNKKLSIITTYSKNETVTLVGLKDHGIEHAADLKGKSIGLARGTINEFYLGRLLDLNKIDVNDVSVVDVKLTELGDALSSGKVDAIVAGSKNLYPLIQQQGSNAFLWRVHSGQSAFGTLVGKDDWMSRHTEPVKRLLNALSQAEQFVNRNPGIAKAILQKKLNYDNEYLARVWSEYQFSLSLDQSLILAMEDEARWMIGNNLTTEKTVPNFLDFIYTDGLKSVKPDAVTIAGK